MPQRARVVAILRCMEQNPYQAPPKAESAAASSVEPWRKFTIAAATFTVVAVLGFLVMSAVDYLVVLANVGNYWAVVFANLLCVTAFLGLLAWTFGSVFLLRARRRERSDSSSPP